MAEAEATAAVVVAVHYSSLSDYLQVQIAGENLIYFPADAAADSL